MRKGPFHFHIGLRTVKTVAAVIISMLVVDFYGATSSKLIFAMLGAMAAVQPSFKESLESCLSQVIGVLFGAAMAILLQALPLHPLVCSGIGMILVITLYNGIGIRFSPVLACMIVVSLCYDTGAHPILYACGRIWDTAIGLSVGMLINTMIFPYDNSKRIRQLIHSLDQEVIQYLEEMFDGDDNLPDAEHFSDTIAAMAGQMTIFANQKLLLRMKRQKEQIEEFKKCERKARELLARMEILSHMGMPGRLDEENRRRLAACGADIRDERPLDSVLERDVVTNYHVRQILKLRRELMEELEKSVKREKLHS